MQQSLECPLDFRVSECISHQDLVISIKLMFLYWLLSALFSCEDNFRQHVTFVFIIGSEGNFERFTLGTQVDHLDQPYDFDSIMHYGEYSMSKKPGDRNFKTITPKFDLPDGVFIGQRTHLSSTDIKMIQLLYGCISNSELSRLYQMLTLNPAI